MILQLDPWGCRGTQAGASQGRTADFGKLAAIVHFCLPAEPSHPTKSNDYKRPEGISVDNSILSSYATHIAVSKVEMRRPRRGHRQEKHVHIDAA